MALFKDLISLLLYQKIPLESDAEVLTNIEKHLQDGIDLPFSIWLI